MCVINQCLFQFPYDDKNHDITDNIQRMASSYKKIWPRVITLLTVDLLAM